MGATPAATQAAMLAATSAAAATATQSEWSSASPHLILHVPVIRQKVAKIERKSVFIATLLQLCEAFFPT